jgi:hypothetical protein
MDGDVGAAPQGRRGLILRSSAETGQSVGIPYFAVSVSDAPKRPAPGDYRIGRRQSHRRDDRHAMGIFIIFAPDLARV